MGNDDFLVPLFYSLHETMHILEIPSFFAPNGGAFCLEQAKALKALDHEVRILSCVQLGLTVNQKDYLTLPRGCFEHVMDGVTVYQSYQRGLPKAVRRNMRSWVNTVCSMYQDYEKKYGRPDILHAHCAKWAGYAAMLIGREYGIPYVITENMPLMNLKREFGKDAEHAWQIPLLRDTYQNAHLVIPVSEEIVEDTACYFGKDYHWVCCSNVVDTAFYHYQARQQLKDRPFVFCCLAIFDPRKGYDVLAPAFQALRREMPDVILKIAGAGTDSKACRKLMGMDGVVIMGQLDKEQVRALLYESDALVLPSRSEVQPIVLLEAMSTGIPVISTECVPQNERLEGACRIVAIDDVQALTEEMKNMVLQYDQYDGQRISQRIGEMASPEVVGKRLSELFAQVKGSTPEQRD